MSDETRRIIIKKGQGVPTIPTSNDHRDGSWLNTDIYEGEFYLNTLTGVIYTLSSGVITNLSVPSVNSSSILQHSVKLAEGVTKGQAVYVSGATGTNMLVSKASNDTEAMSSKTMGLVDATGVTNDIVNLVTEGLLNGLNTNTATIGDPVWLGTSGNLLYGVANKPVAPAHMVFIGIVTRVSATVGEIFVKVQNGFELQELHNVSIISPANGDKLTYNSTTQLWENYQDLMPMPTAHEVYRGVNYANNSTTETTYGGVIIATTGSTIARSVSSTNFASKQIRKGFYASVVSTGRLTSTRGSALLWYLGGGWRYVCEVYISDTAYGSGCRQFYGMNALTTDMTYTDTITVASMLNVIGVGSDAADTNLQVFHNDGSGTCTKIDLGVDFPANRTAGSALTTTYSIELFNANASSSVIYKVTNNETGVIAVGEITTNLPLDTQGLNFVASRCMGTAITNTGQFDLAQLGVYSL